MPENLIQPCAISAVILAGGQATRMGSVDKGLSLFENRPLVEYPIALLKPFVQHIFISANRNLAQYQRYQLPVIEDTLNNIGPLAGILNAQKQANTEWLLCLPCDMPLINAAIIKRLLQTPVNGLSRIAHDGKRSQHLLCLIHKDTAKTIELYIEQQQYKVKTLFEQLDAESVDCSDNADCFKNINTLEDLQS